MPGKRMGEETNHAYGSNADNLSLGEPSVLP